MSVPPKYTARIFLNGGFSYCYVGFWLIGLFLKYRCVEGGSDHLLQA